MLYRAFRWDPLTEPQPLLVPEGRQGTGRHDNPHQYIALYLSRQPESAVAERIQGFRGRELSADDLTNSDGRVLALASIDDSALPPVVDLDDPSTLVELGRRPSQVATGDRSLTQQLALELHLAGAAGIAWWSILEASWTNVTLFQLRPPPARSPVSTARRLTIDDPDLVIAAERLGIHRSTR